jgi:hypothetical protein
MTSTALPQCNRCAALSVAAFSARKRLKEKSKVRIQALSELASAMMPGWPV